MTRTSPTLLVLLAVLGGGLGWLLQTALSSMGRAVFSPPWSLTLVLAAIGVILVAMAWPVRRATRRVEGARIDPFYATRVVVLAKASSIAGALMAGAGLGLVGFLVSRSVVAVGSMSMAIAMTVGAVVLVVGGLVAEHMCVLPPDDDETPQNTPRPRGI